MTTLDVLREVSFNYRHAEKTADALRSDRNRLVAIALAEGATHAQIAEASGISRGRISQLAKP